MELPQSVLAFKLLDGTLLEHKDRQSVLTTVDYSNVETLLSQMKVALKKFFGDQSKPAISTEDSSIKYEAALATRHEECNMNYRKRSNFSRGSTQRKINYSSIWKKIMCHHFCYSTNSRSTWSLS